MRYRPTRQIFGSKLFFILKPVDHSQAIHVNVMHAACTHGLMGMCWNITQLPTAATISSCCSTSASTCMCNYVTLDCQLFLLTVIVERALLMKTSHFSALWSYSIVSCKRVRKQYHSTVRVLVRFFFVILFSSCTFLIWSQLLWASDLSRCTQYSCQWEQFLSSHLEMRMDFSTDT